MSGHSLCDTAPEVIPAREILEEAPEDLPALSWSCRPPEGRVLRLLAVGDTSLSGEVCHQRTPEQSMDLLQDVLPTLTGTDLLFANFEGSLVGETPDQDHFSAPVGFASVLSAAGFGLLNLANNHALDLGREGLRSTVEELHRRGIEVLGAGNSRKEASRLIQTVTDGIRIGWLGAGRTDFRCKGEDVWTVNELDEDSLVDQVGLAKHEVDCLVVSVHAGFMFIDYPDPRTRSLAGRLASAGADLVLMHHPHVLQGVEIAPEGCVICYSLGNFFFDWKAGQIRNPVVEDRQREGAIFSFALDDAGVSSFAIVPTVMSETCKVQWPDRDHATAILNRVERITHDLLTDAWKQGFNRQRAERNTSHGIRMFWHSLRRGELGQFARQAAKIRPGHLAMLFRWLAPKRGTRR